MDDWLGVYFHEGFETKQTLHHADKVSASRCMKVMLMHIVSRTTVLQGLQTVNERDAGAAAPPDPSRGAPHTEWWPDSPSYLLQARSPTPDSWTTEWPPWIEAIHPILRYSIVVLLQCRDSESSHETDTLSLEWCFGGRYRKTQVWRAGY